MGFLKNLMKQEKPSEENDPDWEELKKFRKDQKRQHGGDVDDDDSLDNYAETDNSSSSKNKPGYPGGATGEMDSSAGSHGNLDLDEDMVPTIFSRPAPTVVEYKCNGCGKEFKESWNKCPKCGGDVRGVGLDRTEDAKKLYPVQQMPAPPPPPPAPMETTNTAQAPGRATAQKVSTKRPVKKIRKPTQMGRPGTSGASIQGTRKAQSGTSNMPPLNQDPSLVKPVKSKIVRTNAELDDLFSEDPLVDLKDDHPEPPKTIRKMKGSWKKVQPFQSQTEPSYKPPPEIKSMLSELMTTDLESNDDSGDGSCPKCGFKNPSGTWDFCMGCGVRFN